MQERSKCSHQSQGSQSRVGKGRSSSTCGRAGWRENRGPRLHRSSHSSSRLRIVQNGMMARHVGAFLGVLLLKSAFSPFADFAPTRAAAQATRDPDCNDGLTVFYLSDPNDKMCLGPNGFTACDTSSLWLYPSRNQGEDGHSLVALLEPDPARSCLSRHAHHGGGVGVRGCARRDSTHWLLEGPNSQGYFRLSDDFGDVSKRECVTRYKVGGKKNTPGPKGRLRNSVSTQPCEKRGVVTGTSDLPEPADSGRHRHVEQAEEEEAGYVQLDIVETAVHDAGFYLVTFDGLCFDGHKYRRCEPVPDLLWGVGLTFAHGGRGDVERTLFQFHYGGSVGFRCLVEDVSSGTVGLGACDNNKRARRWGLGRDGRLTRENGRVCVVRTLDNGAASRPCADGWFEHLTVEIPAEVQTAREESARYYQRQEQQHGDRREL